MNNEIKKFKRTKVLSNASQKGGVRSVKQQQR